MRLQCGSCEYVYDVIWLRKCVLNCHWPCIRGCSPVYSIIPVNKKSLKWSLFHIECWCYSAFWIQKETLPNVNPTNIAPGALWRIATPWRPADPRPLGGTEVGCKVGPGGLQEASHPSAYSFILLLASVPPVVSLQWFWPPPADLKPPLCLLKQHRVGFQPSTAGWIVEAGLNCANPPHVHQRSTEGPLDVIRQSPCPPLCLLPPPGGRLWSMQKCL